MSYHKSPGRRPEARAGRSQRTALRNRAGAPEGMARVVAEPQRGNAETLLQLQRLYGNRSVTQLVTGQPGRRGLIQRADGLPTDHELVERAGGYGAGKKLFGKSAFHKILIALKTYRNDIDNNDADAKLDKLLELMEHIQEWRISPDRRKIKKGDPEKREALVTLEREVRAQLLLLASDPHVGTDPEKLSLFQARIRPWLANTPHLNDGSNVEENLRIDEFREYRSTFHIPAQVNCALCSCAAVIRHVTGLTLTTGDLIIRLHAQTNPGGLHYQFNGKLPPDYQKMLQHPGSFTKLGYQKMGVSDTERINATNIDKIQECCQLFGINSGPVERDLPLAEAILRMEALLPEGYVFAVLISGEGHWNFAHGGLNGKLEFIDYQSDHAEFDGPASGSTPQVGIVKRSMRVENQVTDFIAFKR